jgi:hypothetical protein
MVAVTCPQEVAWREAEASAISLMGTLNAAAAELVVTIRMLLDTDGWVGWGVRSPEHWVSWKAGVAPSRASALVDIARRATDLPQCFAAFRAGRLTEDAMVRIARRVPASHDEEVARRSPDLLIRQLERVLAALPPVDLAPDRPRRKRERELTIHRIDGHVVGRFCLPADEGAQVEMALGAAREAEYRDRQGLEPDAVLEPGAVRTSDVTNADALVRLGSEALDALDPELARTGHRGERHKVMLHVDVGPDGSMGTAQLHLGPTVPDSVARFMTCDAEVIVAAYRAGQLIGITPTTRTVNRHLRRAIERRDQGCAHPTCTQARWLHIHHIAHWRHGGLTIPPNLVCLCPTHHRELHQGELSIEGDPEAGTLRFLDKWGRPIEPPGTGPPRLPDPSQPSPFTPPLAERLDTLCWHWNTPSMN